MARLRQSVYFELQFLNNLAEKNPPGFMRYAGMILRGERVWDKEVLEETGGVEKIKHECRCLIGRLRDANDPAKALAGLRKPIRSARLSWSGGVPWARTGVTIQ